MSNVLSENGMIEIFIVKGESIQSILDRSEIITKFLVFNLNILYYKKITLYKNNFKDKNDFIYYYKYLFI